MLRGDKAHRPVEDKGGQGDSVHEPVNGLLTFLTGSTGIEPGDLSRILLPFEQVEDRMKHTTQGTGLGLALSKSLTELHGGTLSLESEPGVGTTVTLRFLPECTLVTQPRLPLHL